jgi:hypothetical protein
LATSSSYAWRTSSSPRRRALASSATATSTCVLSAMSDASRALLSPATICLKSSTRATVNSSASMRSHSAWSCVATMLRSRCLWSSRIFLPSDASDALSFAMDASTSALDARFASSIDSLSCDSARTFRDVARSISSRRSGSISLEMTSMSSKPLTAPATASSASSSTTSSISSKRSSAPSARFSSVRTFGSNVASCDCISVRAASFVTSSSKTSTTSASVGCSIRSDVGVELKGVRSGVERRRGRVLKARARRRDATGKVLKKRRSPRRRGRTGTSVR